MLGPCWRAAGEVGVATLCRVRPWISMGRVYGLGDFGYLGALGALKDSDVLEPKESWGLQGGWPLEATGALCELLNKAKLKHEC